MTATTLISVVDDDESVRDSTRTLLRSAGYKVATFESGELFLKSEALPDTDCLILDMRMPGMGGLELQRKLNASDAGLPVIFFTAHDDRINRQSAIDGGATAYFQKPFAARDLLAAVETAINRNPAISEAGKGR